MNDEEREREEIECFCRESGRRLGWSPEQYDRKVAELKELADEARLLLISTPTWDTVFDYYRRIAVLSIRVHVSAYLYDGEERGASGILAVIYADKLNKVLNVLLATLVKETRHGPTTIETGALGARRHAEPNEMEKLGRKRKAPPRHHQEDRNGAEARSP